MKDELGGIFLSSRLLSNQRLLFSGVLKTLSLLVQPPAWEMYVNAGTLSHFMWPEEGRRTGHWFYDSRELKGSGMWRFVCTWWCQASGLFFSQLPWFLRITYQIPIQTCATSYLEWSQTHKKEGYGMWVNLNIRIFLDDKLTSISIQWGKGVISLTAVVNSGPIQNFLCVSLKPPWSSCIMSCPSFS